MRIPLDYYQILGVPESNLSELEQAYQDRLLQLPRQGYSDAAIDSRKRLITVAYQVLKEPQQREQYEAERMPSILISTGDAAAHHRSALNIEPEHFIGGLLILLELGEYEEINSICMPYLGNNGRNSNSGSLHPHPMRLTPSGNLRADSNGNIDPAIIARVTRTATGDRIIPLKPDIVLTMIFSFLELGDREWRDNCYEEAVIHFETAKKILVQEDLFPQIQGQIERRLDRLRPYRVSSLVALPLDRHEQRRQGIQFLEELLESACINEVQCQERFGLNSERTIQFIHETLPFLTAAEQRNLFSQIARDSYQLGTNALNVMQLACTYLHVHALIAQGFAYRNPQLIYTAQQILQYRLCQRLDVTIEQAICALLLGQTEEANQILLSAPESAALVVIRQQSQGYADLLRGLCWYVESWFKDEVFPCFLDLVAKDPALNAYFNDRDVQDFAERVPAADSPVSSWTTSTPQLIDVPASGDLSGTRYPNQSSFEPIDSAQLRSMATAVGLRSSGLSSAFHPNSSQLGSGNVAPAVRVEQIPDPTAPVPTAPTAGQDATGNKVIQLERERQRRRPSMPIARTIDGQFEEIRLEDNRQQTPLVPQTSSQLVPTRKDRQLTRTNGTGTIIRSRRPRRKPNLPRILLVGTGGVACVWGSVWLVNSAWRGITGLWVPSAVTSSPSRPSPQPDVKLASKSTKTQLKAPIGLLTPDLAQQIVKNWLSAKKQSLSEKYQTAQLKDILVEPALSSVIDRSQTAKANGVHWNYQHHSIAIDPIAPIDPLAKTATIQAKVKEDSQYYQGDRLNPNRSYSKTILVEYTLVRQDDRWYIKDMDAIRSVTE